VSCDVYVLETLKAEGDGLETEHRLCSVAWSFDEKKEFCARTWFGLKPRVWLKLWIWSFFSVRLEPLVVFASQILGIFAVAIWQ
jgi:hypothetical protein